MTTESAIHVGSLATRSSGTAEPDRLDTAMRMETHAGLSDRGEAIQSAHEAFRKVEANFRNKPFVLTLHEVDPIASAVGGEDVRDSSRRLGRHA
jgi:hypothetical protein